MNFDRNVSNRIDELVALEQVQERALESEQVVVLALELGLVLVEVRWGIARY